MKYLEIKYTLILGLCIGLMTSANAQYTLPELLDLAVKNHPSMLVAKEQLNFTEQSEQAGKIAPLSRVTGSLGNIQNPGDVDYSLAFEQEIINPAKNQAIVGLNQSNTLIRKAELGQVMVNVKQQVRDYYYQLDYIDQQKKLYQKQIDTYLSISKIARARSNSGDTDQMEALSAESQLHKADQQLGYSQKKYDIVVRHLGALIGVDSLSINFENLQGYAEADWQQNPALKVLDAYKTRAGKEIILSESALKPNFHVGLTNQSFLSSWNNFFLGGGVSIPLFSKNIKSDIESKRIYQKVVDTQISSQQKQLESTYQQLNNSRLSLQQMMQFYQDKSIPEAEVLLQKATLRYNAGELTYEAFYQWHLMLINLEQELTNYRYEYHQTLAALASLGGK